MPRRARFVLPHIPMHIVQRGVNRQTCFGDDHDLFLYERLMEETSAEAGCAVHAYVIMTNHVHILATPAAREAPARLMKRVAQVYSQYFNRKYQRRGPLWGDRYGSSLVDEVTYLMRCYRYVELNPVRAGLVRSASDYRWSSHAANAHGRPSWLTPHPAYERLGSTHADRCAAYRSFISAEIPETDLEEIRTAVRRGLPLGDDAFARRVRGSFGFEERKPGLSPVQGFL